MDDGDNAELEERILLLPPTRRDATAAVAVFRSAGLALTVCEDLAEVCAEMGRGAAVAVVPEEAILEDRGGCLARLLGDQPAWSDFPLVVLSPPGQSAASARALESIGHMTLLQRPIQVRPLVSTVQAALRDRRRQYARRADFIERERQALALRENDRHKDEFLAMLAHELRNPLAAVNNAVAILKQSDDETSRAWAGGVVERQVQQLVRLIDDLLDVSRITSGKIRLKEEFVDARAAIDRAIEAARPLIDERRHILTVFAGREPLPLHADATRIGQIVLNLLTNAAKYTGRGGRIWLEAEREGDQVVIRVRDNGMGIPPEKLPEMFKLFAQGERSIARSEGGLGIGLTLVQRLSEMHGGSVEAQSDGPGRGSEFIVRLPLADMPEPGDPSSAQPAPAPDIVPVATRHRILVVDDNEDTALGLATLLELSGNDVVAAHDGPSALAKARSFRPDIVLLDIGLPGMDGYQVASALRRDDTQKDAVIIALTGYGQDEARIRSRAAGFHHHLVKPVDLHTLNALFRRSAAEIDGDG